MYYFVYTLGFLGVPFLYASEVAPVHLRAAVCGLSTAVSWLFNYLVVEITPIAFATISYRYFIVYAAINASAIPVVYFFYPEVSSLAYKPSRDRCTVVTRVRHIPIIY